MKLVTAILCAFVILILSPDVWAASGKHHAAKNKILVVFFSYSGHTKELAMKIKKQTGADVLQIRTVKPYPSEYQAVVNQAKIEKEKDFRPAINKADKNPADYDIIFIGTPVWWYTMAPPVKTFIASHKLEGKTIMPFCTHGGGGASASFSDMQKLAPKAKIMPGLESYENTAKDRDVTEWIRKNMK